MYYSGCTQLIPLQYDYNGQIQIFYSSYSINRNIVVVRPYLCPQRKWNVYIDMIHHKFTFYNIFCITSELHFSYILVTFCMFAKSINNILQKQFEQSVVQGKPSKDKKGTYLSVWYSKKWWSLCEENNLFSVYEEQACKIPE